MKRIALLFILFLGSRCYSQTYNERSAVLEVGYGVAVPFGKFESTDVMDSASGYATSGTNLNVMFSYLVNKHVGVAAMISSSVNRLNEGGIKSKFQNYAEGIEGVVSDMHFSKWSTTAYLAGCYLTYPLQKASVNFQLLAGYARTEYPDMNVIVYSHLDSNAVEINQTASGVASAFCFVAGAGLKYNISDIMCLCVNADFLSTYPEFEKITTTNTFLRSTPDEFHKMHYRVSLLNVTAGIGFRF